MRVHEVLHTKGSDVVSIPSEATVRDLVALLAEHNIGAVIVHSDEAPLAGIVSERDVVRGLVDGTAVLDAPIAQIMTAKVHTAAPNDTVHDLMLLMTEHRIRHIPVVASDELQGIVSIGDLVKSRIRELEFERDQLESYVSHTQ